MAEKEYPLAAVELQILRQEYPTSELVERAVFEEARAYLLQVGRNERDITPAYDARLRFLTFMEPIPPRPCGPRSRDYLVEISDMIVRKRLDQLDGLRAPGRAGGDGHHPGPAHRGGDREHACAASHAATGALALDMDDTRTARELLRPDRRRSTPQRRRQKRPITGGALPAASGP